MTLGLLFLFLILGSYSRYFKRDVFFFDKWTYDEKLKEMILMKYFRQESLIYAFLPPSLSEVLMIYFVIITMRSILEL